MAAHPGATGPALGERSPGTRAWERRLPSWLAPGVPDREGPRRRSLRITETAIVVAVGLLLTAAVVRDIVRQVGIDERAVIDKRTWVHYTHRQLKLINVTTGIRSNVDVACGPPTRGAHRRLCLIIGGSAHVPLRMIRGGYRLPLTGQDLYRSRSSCFGLAQRRHLCAIRPGGP